MRVILLFLSLGILAINSNPVLETSKTINTPSGSFKGVFTGKVHQFLGITYSGSQILTKDYTEKHRGATCSYDVKQTEEFLRKYYSRVKLDEKSLESAENQECFTLDIYVPELTDSNVDEKGLKPVLVWIQDHNGGPSALYNGSNLASYLDIIVVTIQYRIQKTYVVDDQRAALKWVHSNIQSFNGDRSAITVAGFGTATEDLLQHMTYPAEEIVFQRVVLQSIPLHLPKVLQKNSVKEDFKRVQVMVGMNDANIIPQMTSFDKYIEKVSNKRAVKSILKYHYSQTKDQICALHSFEQDYTFFNKYDHLLSSRNDSYFYVLSCNESLIKNEMDILFGTTLTEVPRSDVQIIKSLGKTYLDALGRFIKTGNPSDGTNFKWPAFLPMERAFCRFSSISEGNGSIEQLSKASSSLWLDVIPHLLEEGHTACEADDGISETIVKTRKVVETDDTRNDPIVSTDAGTIRGSVKTDSSGRRYEDFLGVPFGSIPDRWAKPVEPDRWSGVRDAKEYGSHCYQIIGVFYGFMGMHGNQSEDCLFLNVYIPDGISQVNNLPVMVYFFGGAYVLGTAQMYPGFGLALDGQVIVVTVNYRVGVIGWLATGDSAAPGNYGLWDGRRALQWVQTNIRHFGGDPDRVTIFGQSAGAAMTSHLSISPVTSGLAKRAIMISGGASGILSVTSKFREAAEALALFQFCPTSSSEDMVACLKEVDPGDLDFWSYVATVVVEGMFPTWAPVIDGDFIPRHPRFTWADTGAWDMDIVTGRTHHDMGNLIPLVNPLGMDINDREYGIAEDKGLFWGALDIILNMYQDPDACRQLLIYKYPGLVSNETDERGMTMVKAGTDWLFSSTTIYEASLHAQKAQEMNTYVYEYQYRQTFLRYPAWVTGAHLDDLHSVFGEEFIKIIRETFLGEFSSQDHKMKNSVQAYYTNFAHTGNVNEGPHQVDTVWPVYDTTNRNFLKFAKENVVEQENSDYLDRMEFWNGPWRDVVDPPSQSSEKICKKTKSVRREISEEEITKGVETVRRFLKQIFAPFPGAEKMVDISIDRAIQKREIRKLRAKERKTV